MLLYTNINLFIYYSNFNFNFLQNLFNIATVFFSSPIDLEIGTEWDGTPVTHVPVVVTLDSSDDQFLSITVQAPFFNDPAPPAGDNSNYVGLSDYEGMSLLHVVCSS